MIGLKATFLECTCQISTKQCDLLIIIELIREVVKKVISLEGRNLDYQNRIGPRPYGTITPYRTHACKKPNKLDLYASSPPPRSSNTWPENIQNSMVFQAIHCVESASILRSTPEQRCLAQVTSSIETFLLTQKTKQKKIFMHGIPRVLINIACLLCVNISSFKS